MTFLKVLMIIAGTISLVVGIIGIFVPGLPTTSFLLLTAGLYVRSSDKLYNKLISNRFIGPYITTFREQNGMTRRQKVYSILTMWVMITISITFFIKPESVKLIVAGVGIIGTVVMAFIVRTSDKKTP